MCRSMYLKCRRCVDSSSINRHKMTKRNDGGPFSFSIQYIDSSNGKKSLFFVCIQIECHRKKSSQFCHIDSLTTYFEYLEYHRLDSSPRTFIGWISLSQVRKCHQHRFVDGSHRLHCCIVYYICA